MLETKESNDCVRVDNWASIDGAEAEIVYQGQTVARGTIDGVTEDGSIIWMRDHIGYRRLYERHEFFEVWVPRENTALSYKVSRATT
ncbi:hypothetical protein ACIQGM_20050 [Pseudarthrobacter sp. NPDC092200]|jgi:hypothetical protein|uniref:hypothetical protein n=1 Tax=Pseudarthrobacter TaxID=1742993 RepID=UPI00342008A9